MKISFLKITLVIASLFLFCNSFYIIKKKKKSKHSSLVRKTIPYYNSKLTIIVDKSDYEMKVYDSEGWLVTYPVVFGNKTLADKKMEGDRCTPEGTFRIINKNPNHKWNKFILFDYPTKESYQKFNKRKANGEIPQDANIGGSVGIHGTWPDSDNVIDNYINWTEGCISMKNEDVEELFAMLPLYTKLIIEP